MTVNFVNIHGDQVSVDPIRAKKPKSPARSYHRGWRVVGFSPAQLLQARNIHEQDERTAVLAGAPAPAPFSEAGFMRTNKPKKVRPRPYELKEAAQACADLATKAGWLNVTVEPVAKGTK